MARRPSRPATGGATSAVTAAMAKAGYLPRLMTQGLPRVKPYSEMGVSGVPVYAGYVLTPERNSKLIGQERYRTFADILANTSIVAAGVRYFLNVVARPNWSVEPADDSSEAQKAADWLSNALFEELSTPWSRVIRRCGMYRFHGFSIQEWTAQRMDDGTVGFSDIEARPQWTIWRWEVDDRGTVIGAWQRDPLTGRELGLPRSKIMYLVDDTLTDSPEGLGLLRHLVEPAERLKEYLEQESVGYMRDLRGIPIGYAPMDELQTAVDQGLMTKAQMNQAIADLEAFVNLEKKGRKTSVVLNSQPYVSHLDSGDTITGEKKWGMELVNGVAPGLSEISKAIDRLNYDMARIIGCEHLLLGSSSAGSFALAKEKATDLYLLANSVLRDIRLQAQHDLVWPLWRLNGFDEKLMPKLKSEDVSPKDVEQIARVMRDLAVAGAPLDYDDEAVNAIRDLLGLPQFDPKKYLADIQAVTAAKTPTPQQPSAGQQSLQQDRQDAIDDKQQEQLVKAAEDREVNRTIRELRKVIGSDAADYIHDFVHSDNPKFKGKSKAERIRMALGAYYGKGLFENGHDQRMAEFSELMEKVVPYAETLEVRESGRAAVPDGRPGASDGHYVTDDVVSTTAGAEEGGPSDRALHEGRGEIIPNVAGSGTRTRRSSRRLA